MKQINMKKLIPAFIIIAIIFISSPVSLQAGETIPEKYISLIDSIPDYYQRDNTFGGFPGKGALYCGPVSISNFLFWYGLNGYPRLLDNSGDHKKDQYNLIRKIGSSRYINTGSHGSSPADISSGLKRFLADHGYDSVKIKFYGFRDVPNEFKTGIAIPDMKTAREALYQNKAVLFNIGWYRYDKNKDEYRRNGGHWVALAGYGHDGKKDDPNSMIIHDPDTRLRKNDYLKTEEIKSGKLTGRLKGIPRDAAGYRRYRISNNKFGVIGGMLILEMDKSGSPILPVAESVSK